MQQTMQATIINLPIPLPFDLEDKRECLKELAFRIKRSLTHFLGYEVEAKVSTVDDTIIIRGEINFFHIETTAMLILFFRKGSFFQRTNSVVEIIVPLLRRKITCL